MLYGRITNYVHGRVGKVGIGDTSWPQNQTDYVVRTGYTPSELYVFDQAFPVTSEVSARSMGDFSGGGQVYDTGVPTVYANDEGAGTTGGNSYLAITGTGNTDVCETVSSGNEVWWTTRCALFSDTSVRNLHGKYATGSNVGWFLDYVHSTELLRLRLFNASGSTAVAQGTLSLPVRGVLGAFISVANSVAGWAFLEDGGRVTTATVSLAGATSGGFANNGLWASRPAGAALPGRFLGHAGGEARLALADLIGMLHAI